MEGALMTLVTIYKAFNPAEAQLVRSRLEAAGFHAVVLNENATLYLGTAVASGGILVQVPEDQETEAKEFLKSSVESAE